MKKTVLVILLLALVTAVLYFGYHYFQDRKKTEKADPEAAKIVFRVEEKSYSLADFDNYLRLLSPDRRELPEETLGELFNQFIEDKLILYSALKQGLELTEEEKEAFLRRLVRDYPAEEGLAEKLAADRSLEESLLVEKYKHEKIKEVVVTDDEVKKYYDENKKDFLAPERVRVSQILVESSEQAIKLRERLQAAGEEEFRQAAREFSRAPDAYKGGVMGVFKPGELPADMEKVIFSLQEGRLSTVFQSAYGYHIFRLDKKYSPSLLGPDEAASRIRNLLLEKKVKDILGREVEELKATYHWEVFSENLPFKYEGN